MESEIKKGKSERIEREKERQRYNIILLYTEKSLVLFVKG